jgi:hypothetical protein
LESVKEDPDAVRIAGMQFRVVIAELAVVTRHDPIQLNRIMV